MSFPGATTVIDDFVRGSYPNAIYNGAGASLWTASPMNSGSNVLSVSTPGYVGAQNGGAGGDSAVTLGTSGPDFRYIWEINAAQAAGGYFAFYLNAQPGGAGTWPASALSAMALWVGITAADTWDFHRYNPGSVLVGSSVVQAIAAGSFIGIERVGNSLAAYYKTAAGSWGAPVVTATDSTFNRVGYTGMECGDTTGKIETFLSGTMDPTGTPIAGSEAFTVSDFANAGSTVADATSVRRIG